MTGLENVNGQQVAVDAILNKWKERRKEILIVSGAHGTGVSWTLEKAATEWEKLGGAALHARGEPFAAQRELFPWLTLALPKTKHLARLELIKGWVSQGTRSIPTVGPVTGYIVEELLNHRKRRLARQAVVLSPQEQDLLFIIQTTADNKRLLLTIDNIESWDEASWNLLELILSPNLHELYPALAEAVILIGVHGEAAPRLRSYETKLPFSELKIHQLERRNLRAALSVFGLPDVTEENLDLLYDATCGRLDLLHDFGAHLGKEDFGTLPARESLLYKIIIERRVQGLGAAAAELQDLLAAASIIGQVVAVEDVKCMIGCTQESFLKIIQSAVAARLLDYGGEIIRFQSQMLHQYFFSATEDERLKYHEKFAECLRLMRPSDYEYRLHHLMRAGRTDDALVCYALAALAAHRQRRSLPEAAAQLKNTADFDEIQNFLEVMSMAYDKYNNRLLAESLEVLDRIESFLPSVLTAERDYLEAQIRLKTNRIEEFKRAVEILNRWQTLKESEAEVWSRVAQTLMVASVQINRIEEAQRLEADLTTHYWSRRKVDPWALYSLNILRRRSECLHYLPTATTRLENALDYFGSQNPGELPRHPDQYYYALTNLIGNLIASGRFEEAYRRAVELNDLVCNYPLMPWHALEIASNNFILASYLSGHLDAAQSSGLMEKVIREEPPTGDYALMKNNYAVFLIHAGQEKEAYQLLEKIYAELYRDGDSSSGSGDPDAYHLYFIGNNLAALRSLGGKRNEAEQIWSVISRRLGDFYPAISQTLKKRYELLSEFFSSDSASRLSIEEFDRFLLEKYPAQVGPQWQFYGHGFLFSDIQFWSHG